MNFFTLLDAIRCQSNHRQQMTLANICGRLEEHSSFLQISQLSSSPKVASVPPLLQVHSDTLENYSFWLRFSFINF